MYLFVARRESLAECSGRKAFGFIPLFNSGILHFEGEGDCEYSLSAHGSGVAGRLGFLGSRGAGSSASRRGLEKNLYQADGLQAAAPDRRKRPFSVTGGPTLRQEQRFRAVGFQGVGPPNPVGFHLSRAAGRGILVQ